MAREAAVRLADGVWRIPTTPGDMINSFALAGPDGGLASGNAELVRCALEMLDATRR